MDILLKAFVNKNINTFDENLLNELDKFLNFEDEIILNYYHHNITEKVLIKMEYRRFLKILKYNGGEGGIRTHERVAIAGFQDQCFQPLNHLSLNKKLDSLILSKRLNNNK